MAEENDSIRVEIYDETYNLRGSDPAYIQRLADVVDAKMRAVAQHTSTVDSLRVRSRRPQSRRRLLSTQA